MRTVDHRATLGPASLPSLLAKKSFSTFSWPIWRYSSPTWISLVLSSRSLPFSNTPAAPSSSAFFQAWIWLGWTLNSLASSPTVRSPLSAAKATFALNVALCFCRDCFMTAPVSGPFIGAGLSHSHLSHSRGPSHSGSLQTPKRTCGSFANVDASTPQTLVVGGRPGGGRLTTDVG